MSNNISRSSRRKDAVVTMPAGETLESFTSYSEAQHLVQTLIAHDVRPSALSIVGSDPHVVERVIGRVGYGRAALSSAMSGSWLGLLAGLVVVILSPQDFATPVIAGVVIGAGVGMLTGILLLTFSHTLQRRYRSSQGIIASQYRVVVEHSDSAQAHTAITEHKAHGGD